MVDFARRAKAVVGERAKVMIVGRILDLERADQVIGAGAADLVGMARAHMADPFLVAKALAGRTHETVRCVGANECFNSGGREIICMMNSVMGRERRWGSGKLRRVRGKDARRIVVVGGGPTGMKKAAVAAGRGHAVTISESQSELGGHLSLIERMPTREGWQRAVDNLTGALEAAKVAVHLGVEATAEMLVEHGADTLVVAVGSTWSSTGFSPTRPERESMPGHDADNVLGIVRRAPGRSKIRAPSALGS